MRFTIFQDSRQGDRQGNEDRIGYSYSRDVLLMTVNFVDVMVIDADTFAFLMNVFPSLGAKVWVGGAAAALYTLHRPTLASVFAVTVVANAALMTASGS